MSAIIDCLEFLPRGGFRRWLLVRNPDALMAEAEFSWTLELDRATRFADDFADALKANAGERLPLLPTETPTVPMQLRVVHGFYTEPELPKMQPAPEVIDERLRRQREQIAQAEASVEKKRHVTPEEAYRRTSELLGEHGE